MRYLQKLGPSELPLILDASKWIFDEDAKEGLQVRDSHPASVLSLLGRSSSPTSLKSKPCHGKTLSHSLTRRAKMPVWGIWSTLSTYSMKKAQTSMISWPRCTSTEQSLRKVKVNRSPGYLLRSGLIAIDIASTKARLLDFLNTSDQYRAYRILNRLAADGQTPSSDEES